MSRRLSFIERSKMTDVDLCTSAEHLSELIDEVLKIQTHRFYEISNYKASINYIHRHLFAAISFIFQMPKGGLQSDNRSKHSHINICLNLLLSSFVLLLGKKTQDCSKSKCK